MDDLTPKNIENLQRRLEQRERSLANKIEAVFRLYSVLGMLIALFSLAYFGLSFLQIRLSEDQRLALMMAGTGLTLSIMSRAYLLLRKQSRIDSRNASKELQGAYVLLSQWAKFENTGKAAVNELGLDYNKHSIRHVIDILHAKNVISSGDKDSLEEAMAMRNYVAHNQVELPPEVIQKTAQTLKEISGKITAAFAG